LCTPRFNLLFRSVFVLFLFSRRDIICQIVAAKIVGDEVLTAAYAHELPRYGVKLGLTNFGAAYCVGLLCARRHLQKIGLDEIYKGTEEVTGETFEIEEDDDKRPFRAVLDVGLTRCTTGNKVFAVMKGAVDGGINIPHSEKRFPAYSKEEGFDPEMLKSRIFGNHISEYMEYLMEEDEDRYNKQFSAYIREGLEADAIEDLYLKAHEAIREDPSHTKKEKTVTEHNKTWRMRKITLEQRKQNVRDKLSAAITAE
jgi:large subunit ribosomal protein L5e